jgi:hypothetical protein
MPAVPQVGPAKHLLVEAGWRGEAGSQPQKTQMGQVALSAARTAFSYSFWGHPEPRVFADHNVRGFVASAAFAYFAVENLLRHATWFPPEHATLARPDGAAGMASLAPRPDHAVPP